MTPTVQPPAAAADTTDINEAASLCRALAHPARIRILRHLLRVDRCVCGRIVEILPLAQSTVSQHLKILKEAGLIRGEVEGPKTCYCVNKTKLSVLQQFIVLMLDSEEHHEAISQPDCG
ncbi:MAG: metalloregulator ArsR/SmtB family transcription factor [Desulfobulbaceae bacterium]|nr:metalloregulator ArsR/SmtB family transcription factor [Desulfobulbaceae bacterium]MDY0350994.1 metalloregulator ArsR/SmtB family transcription factor [Desulfobulbaceae bacterium]